MFFGVLISTANPSGTNFLGSTVTVSQNTNASPGNNNWKVIESVDSIDTKPIMTENGAILGTQLEQNQIGVSVDIPGIGKAIQQIRGGNAEELNGLLQSVQLAGDQQQVQKLRCDDRHYM